MFRSEYSRSTSGDRRLQQLLQRPLGRQKSAACRPSARTRVRSIPRSRRRGGMGFTELKSSSTIGKPLEPPPVWQCAVESFRSHVEANQRRRRRPRGERWYPSTHELKGIEQLFRPAILLKVVAFAAMLTGVGFVTQVSSVRFHRLDFMLDNVDLR